VAVSVAVLQSTRPTAEHREGSIMGLQRFGCLDEPWKEKTRSHILYLPTRFVNSIYVTSQSNLSISRPRSSMLDT